MMVIQECLDVHRLRIALAVLHALYIYRLPYGHDLMADVTAYGHSMCILTWWGGYMC